VNCQSSKARNYAEKQAVTQASGAKTGNNGAPRRRQREQLRCTMVMERLSDWAVQRMNAKKCVKSTLFIFSVNARYEWASTEKDDRQDIHVLPEQTPRYGFPWH
jgi:hypothetical protein